jgi:hypothetical protein
LDGHTSVERRSFLQLAGAGLVSAVALSGTAATSEDYTVVEVSPGENWFYRLDDGETFENVLFDCTADDTRVSLAATGENWTIRNVGIRGVHDQTGGHAVLTLEAAGGTDCLVENVWMGDGSSVYDGAGSSETAAWVSPESTGQITFRHCYFKGWKDNGIYASAPGRDGNGVVNVDSCYACNNNHADYRIGSTGSVVKNSVVEHTESGSGVRGIWCWYNDGLEIRNTNIETNGYGAAVHAGPDDPASVTLYDCETSGALVKDGRGDGEISLASGNGNSPDTTVPSGVPTSAEEAARGGPADTDPHDEVALITTPDASGFDYEIEVTGDASREDLGETPSGNPIHSGRAAEWQQETEDGWIFGGTLGDGYGHGFMIEGDVVRFEASEWETGDDPVTDYWVERDGECIVACEEECTRDLPNTIVVDGTDTNGLSKYTFSVSETVEREPELTSVKDGGLPWDTMEDDVSDGTVIGVVGQGQDGYRFSGELTSSQFDDDLTVDITFDDC